MKASLPAWRPAEVPVDSVAPSASASASADDEPVPSDRFRATALVDVRGLQIAGSTRTDAPALATGISLSVARGEVIALVGVAGSGTREIALAIAGRLPAPAVIAAGSILIDGQEVVGASPRALKRIRESKIALIAPGLPTGLSPGRTIGRQLARTLRRQRGLSRTDAARRALELLEQVGLPDPLATSLLLWSQLDEAALIRVSVAVGVSFQPDLLILAENAHARALDAAGETDLLELCRGFRREVGLSIIVVSGDLGIVAATCDRVAVVDAGRVVEQGSAAEIVAAPQHPRTRSLLEAARTGRN